MNPRSVKIFDFIRPSLRLHRGDFFCIIKRIELESIGNAARRYAEKSPSGGAPHQREGISFAITFTSGKAALRKILFEYKASFV